MAITSPPVEEAPTKAPVRLQVFIFLSTLT